MRKHIILFFSALLFLFSCHDDKAAKGIIDRDEMVRLLADVHLVDGSLTTEPNGDNLFNVGTGRYMYLFKTYHTDSAQFKKSVAYYSRQPELAGKMYDDIIKILQAKSDSVNKLVTKDNETVRKRMERQLLKEQQKAKDSIKMILEKDKIKIRRDSAIAAERRKQQLKRYQKK